jgi:hypothetical protein
VGVRGTGEVGSGVPQILEDAGVALDQPHAVLAGLQIRDLVGAPRSRPGRRQALALEAAELGLPAQPGEIRVLAGDPIPVRRDRRAVGDVQRAPQRLHRRLREIAAGLLARMLGVLVTEPDRKRAGGVVVVDEDLGSLEPV